MSEAPKRSEKSADYKKAVAKQRRIKKLRKMKIKDRAGDVVVSDISDVEVVGNGDEESQDDWLNDLLKSDGDGGKAGPVDPSHPMETTTTDHSSQNTLASKICAFTYDNSALLGVGIVTVALSIFARLRK
ncbi:uncharacterized protein CELE_C06G4.4 [Caenorhabditis elegans]|uniref:Uncharacterized protein C06G4.4 n=1 Tax=Caenorhabditis elegans TaxID=6239 RepID=YKR4_CAEEL|nr:Uncharacterized protein CELE_C06G4.4 [Caenorhabditis elegans]P34310.1 RecName: Full=Uncharacterized protein C06G4.4 [Caenorhabditis elegans]CCD63436.1 Uncharacterized protein CELE_C06G4.4 [Caenorhabditis elegans]|eukprot:NP_498739.1 Uncharacterized protein CELE_C06G4.4 [Caenorhabditis elegans]